MKVCAIVHTEVERLETPIERLPVGVYKLKAGGIGDLYVPPACPSWS